MAKEWKIVSSQGGPSGAELIDCRLVQTEFGFEFEDPQKSKLSSKEGLMPILPFSFSEFEYKGHHWTITVDSAETSDDPSKKKNEATGRWKTGKPAPPDDEDGTWVAQAGGKGEDLPEDASSAYA
jgi:hypothetical protein